MRSLAEDIFPLVRVELALCSLRILLWQVDAAMDAGVIAALGQLNIQVLEQWRFFSK
jgi:hypothetical protein